MFGFKKKVTKVEKTSFELYMESVKEFDAKFDQLQEMTKKMMEANKKMTEKIDQMVRNEG